MHRVRRAVRENRLNTSAITEESYVPAIESTGRGWVVESNGDVLGFAVGNVETGNIWALFVHPEYERQGIGRALLDTMVKWLFDQGLPRLNLTTEPGTRAQRFYEESGWSQVGYVAGGDAAFELSRPVKSDDRQFGS
jgi:GNAT superfamily N-acetyltransferase